MANILITPINYDLYQGIYRQPTGAWVIPALVVKESDPVSNYQALNEDLKYRARLLDYLLFDLKEHWLYQKADYIRLTQYLERRESKGGYEIVIRKNKKGPVASGREAVQLLQFIEDHVISIDLIEKVAKDMIALTGLNWYDLSENKEYLIEKVAREIKKSLEDVMYKISDPNQE